MLASIGIAIEGATAVLLIQALLAGAGATVFQVVDNICAWLNACSNGITAKITSPTAGSTVSGTTSVSAAAEDAITVSFYADGNTPIGTDNTGPNWDTDWDTRKFSNGKAHGVGLGHRFQRGCPVTKSERHRPQLGRFRRRTA
ncbi:Ig-like domain-containing protein [Streptomyces tanashiensis]|uniref:Ig-like domain-containing protein n=1 Tax=Streptomyces tanashiensis TaxID=67367 RepID=UPI0033CB00DE